MPVKYDKKERLESRLKIVGQALAQLLSWVELCLHQKWQVLFLVGVSTGGNQSVFPSPSLSKSVFLKRMVKATMLKKKVGQIALKRELVN